VVLHDANKRSVVSLAFYNCGEFSGASQSHKHLQIIPLPDDSLPLNACIYNARDKKPGEIFEFSELPFVHYVTLLDPQKSGRKHDAVGEYLNELYHSLLDTLIEDLHDQSFLTDTGPPSYNFVVTHTWMMIVPRRSEKYDGSVSVNSLGFAGMLLLRSDEELEFTRKVGILKILEGVAIPKKSDMNGSIDEV